MAENTSREPRTDWLLWDAAVMRRGAPDLEDLVEGGAEGTPFLDRTTGLLVAATGLVEGRRALVLG